MLVFAAITPHPPLLLPSVGKEEQKKLAKTREAFEELERDLYAAKPHRIIIITPHEGVFEDAFTINAHTNLHAHFDTFGDLETSHSWHGDPELAANIQHAGNKKNVPVQLISNEQIEHGASIPLMHLTNHLEHIKVLPIGYSGLDPQQHIAFGHMIKDIVMNSDKRTAVIASGDLAHTLSENAPGGLHTDGAWFDTVIKECLTSQSLDAITSMDPIKIANAEECAYRSLLILRGILGNMHTEFELLNYEAPFGVGYLTGQFHM